MISARFDDAVAGVSRVLTGYVGSLVAEELGDVAGVIEAAEAAAREGHWVAGYVAYEASSAFDPTYATNPAAEGPLAWFGVFGGCVESDYSSASGDRTPNHAVSHWSNGVDRTGYDAAFEQVRTAIKHGDTYQVNLTFPLRAAVSGDPAGLYRDLIGSQKPAYAAHISHGSTHVISVSPERFFTVKGGRVGTRPMKGTAKRGRWSAEDERAREELAASAKDRAENLMIVDLIRNDLGRVAEFGSVSVDELFTVERFETLWQMTSAVSAQLRDDVGLLDIFTALFPCGSVTGAPKASSMQVIADLEQSPRGVYCGTVGYIPPGNGLEGASFSVAIRTVEIDTEEGIATYGVGGGVTWYSDADEEYEETATKALVLRREPSPTSLFETIRWDPSTDHGWVWLDEHLDRLASSAAYWGIPLDRSRARALLNGSAAELSAPSRVRLVAGTDGLHTTTAPAPERFAVGPGPHGDAVVLALDDTPIDSTNPRLFHKIVDRSLYQTRTARHRAADDVMLVNEHGMVTETTIANVAFLIDGLWVTPPREDGLLAGVLRRSLLDEGSLKERSVTVDEALVAPAVAVINSVRGWRSAVIDPML